MDRTALTQFSSLDFAILTLSILLVPTKSFYIYFLVNSFVLILFYAKDFSLNRNGLLIFLFISLFVYLIVAAQYRMYVFGIDNIRDYAEIVRFLPVALIVMARKRFKYDLIDIFLKITFVYIVLDVVVTIAQFLSCHLFVFNIIGKMYSSDLHLDSSLAIARRALGLSQGPGQHGAILLFLFICFLVFYYLFDVNRKRIIAGLFLCSIGILFSQSQTVAVSWLFINMFISTYAALFGSNKLRKRAVVVILFLVISIGSVCWYYSSELEYLYSFVIQGLNRSSYLKREVKWLHIFDAMKASPSLLLIGYGKEYFGVVSRAMDNEFLYFLSVYGAFPFGIYLFGSITYILRSFVMFKFDIKLIVSFLLLAGFAVSWTGSFFLDPRIMLLFTLITIIVNNDQCVWEVKT